MFGKVFYGNLSAHDLLTWIALHRLQGVNKVLIYPYQMSTAAIKVLRHFQGQGFVDVIPFARHSKGLFEAMGAFQGYNDQEVTELDALQRLRGYDYLVNFDMDEYILSRKGEQWKTLFDRLVKSNNNVGAFWFPSYIFAKTWGPVNAASPFSVCKYLYRTNITSDTPKLAVIPSKVRDAGLSTHYSVLIDGYHTHNVNHEDAAIHHFRACRPEWMVKDAAYPCFNVTRNYDETVLNYFKQAEKDIMHVVTKVGL